MARTWNYLMMMTATSFSPLPQGIIPVAITPTLTAMETLLLVEFEDKFFMEGSYVEMADPKDFISIPYNSDHTFIG